MILLPLAVIDDDDEAPTPTRHLTGQHAAIDPGPTLHERIKSLEDSRRFWRWIAGLGLPLIFTGALSIVLYSADKITASSERVGATLARLDAVIKIVDGLQSADIGAVQARIEALNRLIDSLQQDIRDLRRELHKLSGTDARQPNSDDQHFHDLPDKVGLLDITLRSIRSSSHLLLEGTQCALEPAILSYRSL